MRRSGIGSTRHVAIVSQTKPQFVKAMPSGGRNGKTFATYIEEVRQGIFPGDEHSFHMDAEQIDKLYGGQNESL